MFKQIVTLFRGVATQTSEEFTDRHALAILKQQINDCASTVSASRRAVAIAIAQNEQEIVQHKRLVGQISDLETRAIAAIEQGKKILAQEAAESIAVLEAERDVSARAQAQFSAEIKRLKSVVRTAEAKLKELRRGQRLATATDQTQRLRKSHTSNGLTALKDAEETLQRLQVRQQQIDTTADAIAEMEQCENPTQVIERLAEAGCGERLTSSADDVLARLQKLSKKKK